MSNQRKIANKTDITNGVPTNHREKRDPHASRPQNPKMDNAKARSQQKQRAQRPKNVASNADELFNDFVSGKNVDMSRKAKPQGAPKGERKTFSHNPSVPVRPDNDASSRSFPMTPKEKAELKRKQKEEAIKARKAKQRASVQQRSNAPSAPPTSAKEMPTANDIVETTFEELSEMFSFEQIGDLEPVDEDEDDPSSKVKSKAPPGKQDRTQPASKRTQQNKPNSDNDSQRAASNGTHSNAHVSDVPVQDEIPPQQNLVAESTRKRSKRKKRVRHETEEKSEKKTFRILSSNKPEDKMRLLRRSSIVYEGDVAAVSRRFMPSNIRAWLVYAICAAIVLVCLVMFALYIDENNNASAELTDVGDSFTMPEMLPVEKQMPDLSGSWPPIVDFNALKAKYPDVAGWIRIPGTNVDYPVLTNSEENYYLHRSITGAQSTPGSIFCDSMNTNDLSQQHIVIYGHHMIYASMFHDVSKYNNKNFFNQHRVIYFETPELTYVLKPIAMYYCTPEEVEVRKVLFKNSQAFQSYLDNRLQRGDVIKYDDYTRETLDKLVTLITCDATGDNRQIVECVPVQVYPTDMIPSVIQRGEADMKAKLGL